MSSSERKVELESRFCELEKKSAEDEVVLKQKQIALKHALRNLPELQIRWKLHTRNRAHAKNQADVVDLREYGATLKLWGSAKADLDDALLHVATLKSEVAHYQEKVDESDQEKTRIEDELGSYGQLIQFRKAS